jgi:hypothetical protein
MVENAPDVVVVVHVIARIAGQFAVLRKTTSTLKLLLEPGSSGVKTTKTLRADEG